MGVNNYRYDPFLDVASPVTKTNERASIPASSPYTVRLQEVPLKESPTSLTVRVVNWLSAALTIGATTCDVINGSWFAINDVITIVDSIRYTVRAYVGGRSTKNFLHTFPRELSILQNGCDR